MTNESGKRRMGEWAKQSVGAAFLPRPVPSGAGVSPAVVLRIAPLNNGALTSQVAGSRAVSQVENVGMSVEQSIVPAERIEECIFVIRGQKVMLSADLAELYGVRNPRADSGCPQKSRPLSLRFHVLPHPRGDYEDITNCDILHKESRLDPDDTALRRSAATTYGPDRHFGFRLAVHAGHRAADP